MLILFFFSHFWQNCHIVTQLAGKGIRENGGAFCIKTNQRDEPRERDGGEIDQQMPMCRALCTSLPSSSFPLRWRPAFSQTLNYLLHTGRLAVRPDDLQCLCKLLPSRKRLTPSMQKDQISMSRFGEGRLRRNPVNPSLLFCYFACRLCFGLIASLPFVFEKTCFCNQKPPIEELADGIRKVDMGLAFKQVVNGIRNRPRSGHLVCRSKRRTDVTASVPSHERMIFEIQKEFFLHLAAERLSRWAGLSCFPTGNPAGDALSCNFEQVDATHADFSHEMTSLFETPANNPMNFHLLLLSIPEDKLIWKLTICS